MQNIELFSVYYRNVQIYAEVAQKTYFGTLMGKFDVFSAFLVP